MIKQTVWFALLLLLAACGPQVDVAQPGYTDETAGEIWGEHTVGQTFVAFHDGLSAVDIFLATYERANTGLLTFHLRSAPKANADLYTVTGDVSDVVNNAFHRFAFPPIPDSNGRRYYFELSAPAAGPGNAVTTWHGKPNSYANGALYLDGKAQEGQVAFHLGYSRPRIVLGLLSDVTSGLPTALAGLALFLLPGLVLMVWLFPRIPADMTTLLIAATGVSVALAPLVLLASHLLGWRWGPVSTWIALLLCAVLVAWRWRSQARWRITVSFDGLLLLGVLACVLLVRLLVIQPYTVPLWGDSVQHTVIAQMFVDHGGLTDSWSPYAPFHSLTVHYGFHAIAAFFQWVTGLPTPHAVLLIGQIINALAALALYPLALRISNGRRWAGILAVLVAGMLTPIPMVYVNWGRYPQLAGQMILPVALWLLWELADAPRRDVWRGALLAALVAAGMALTYYRMPYYYAAFLPVWLLGYALPRYRFDRSRWLNLARRLALVGVLAGIALAVWMPRFLSGRLGQGIVSHLGATNPLDVVLEQYRAWLRLAIIERYIPRYLVALTVTAIIWSVARRRWSAMVAGGWLVALLGLIAARLIPIPGATILDPFAVFIALYLPVAYLVGWLVSEWLNLLQQRNARQARVACLVLCLVGIMWGGRQQLRRFDPTYALVVHPDLAAMDWIRENTRPEARFLVNGFRIYNGRSVVGSDAGWWIPLLADRQNTIPPQYAILNELPDDPDYVHQTVNLVAQLEQTSPTTPEGLQLLCARGITHAYIGQGQGRVAQQELTPYLVPAELLDSPAFELCYHQDRVWIFALADEVCDG